MDWHAWIKQHMSFTEIKRGGATVWVIGGKGLLDDSLGSILHSHDRASEIFYFLSGRCRLEIGDSEEYFGPAISSWSRRMCRTICGMRAMMTCWSFGLSRPTLLITSGAPKVFDRAR